MAGGDNGAWVDQVSYQVKPSPPRVITQPTPLQTVCEGSRVQWTVTATGAPPLTYQWQKDGVDLTGETVATLVLPGVTLAEAGTYTVRVSDAVGQTVSSGPAVLVSNRLGSVVSEFSEIMVARAGGIDLAEAVDQPERPLVAGSPAQWVGQECETHDGVDAAAVQGLARGAEAWFQQTFVGPGVLSYW